MICKHSSASINGQPLRALIKSHIQPRESWRIRQHHAMVFAAPCGIGHRCIGETEIKYAIARYAPARQNGDLLHRLRRKTFYRVTIQCDNFGHNDSYSTSRCVITLPSPVPVRTPCKPPQSAGKHRSMAAIKCDALRPLVADSGRSRFPPPASRILTDSGHTESRRDFPRLAAGRKMKPARCAGAKAHLVCVPLTL